MQNRSRPRSLPFIAIVALYMAACLVALDGGRLWLDACHVGVECNADGCGDPDPCETPGVAAAPHATDGAHIASVIPCVIVPPPEAAHRADLLRHEATFRAMPPTAFVAPVRSPRAPPV